MITKLTFKLFLLKKTPKRKLKKMNLEEALIYLPVDEENEAQDLYEEKLFELKQFFLNRFPMSKLINARLSKFEKIEEAYQTLGGAVPGFDELTVEPIPDFGSVHDLYGWYNLEKNALRLKLSSSESLGEVRLILNQYINVTKHYAECWSIPIHGIDTSEIKLGVEPNPMDVQAALEEISTIKKIDSEYILSLPDENWLKSEAKRLSLWLNFESNEQSV